MPGTIATLELPTSEELDAAEAAIFKLVDDHIQPLVDRLTAYLRHDDQLDREEPTALGVVRILAFLAEARDSARDIAYALEQLLTYASTFRNIVEEGDSDPATIGGYWHLTRKRIGNA